MKCGRRDLGDGEVKVDKYHKNKLKEGLLNEDQTTARGPVR